MVDSRIIAVRLTPRASSDRVGEVRNLPRGEEQLAIYVTAAPEDGKANDAMIGLLAKHFNVVPSRLSVVRGHTNRNKWVRIE